MIVVVLKRKTLDSGFVFSSSVGCSVDKTCYAVRLQQTEL